ncbi:MAG: hypothetical protein R6W79_03605, partial [Acidimicrobiia bacterium]
MAYDLSSATAASVREATAEAITRADGLVDSSIGANGASFMDRIAPLDAAVGIVQDANGYGPLLANFHPDKDVRDAGNEAEQTLSTWVSDLLARRDVYDSVLTVDDEGLEGLEARSLVEWVRDLRRAGHDLSSEDRTRGRAPPSSGPSPTRRAISPRALRGPRHRPSG